MQEENNYSVYEHITPDGMYYFGVAKDIKKRWSGNGSRYKTTSLQPYIDKYGWDNIQHQVLFTNQTKENALWIEDFLIKTAREDGVCINRHRSGYIAEDRNAYHKQYIKEHREKRNKYQRKYYQQYREEHREESRTYMRNYMRKYSQKKKYLKQLNELGYIPLF